MPLIGILGFTAGAGMLYTAKFTAEQLARFLPVSGALARVISGGMGVLLMLWGVRLIASRFGPKVGKKVSRLNRQRVMLPREGMMYLLIMIVAFVASLIGRSNMLMLVFSIMAGPFILNGWVTFSLLKHNRLSRRLPRRAMVGDPVSVEVALQNRKMWFSSWLMMVRDRVARDGVRSLLVTDDSVLEPAVLFASVRPGQERTARYRLRLNQRGRYLFGPLEVSTRFPLGLVERGFITDVRDELIVHPQIGHLTSEWRRDARLAAEMVTRQQTQRGMFEDEFHHLRDYRPGDNPRDIHWRTSARMNDLMVREFHQSRDRGLILLLDLWQPDRPQQEDLDRVEFAVSFAATICVDHLRETRGVEQHLLIAGKEVSDVRADAGSAAMEALLDALALATAGQSEGLAEIVATAAQEQSALHRVVLISSRPEEELIELRVADRPLARGESADAAPHLSDRLPGIEFYPANPQSVLRLFRLEVSDSDQQYRPGSSGVGLETAEVGA
ncbi:MAG: DUF58 domain-containing protein [Planctomycetota bacterium]